MRYLVFIVTVFFSFTLIAFQSEVLAVDLYHVALDTGFIIKQCRTVKVHKDHTEVLGSFKLSGEGSIKDLQLFLMSLETQGIVLGTNFHIKVKKNGTLAYTMDLHKLCKG